MYIEKLFIENFRVIKRLEIHPTKRINIIIGPNGSGKTSLLESIYLLARNKSFRTNKIKNIIADSHKHLTISAIIINGDHSRINIGLRKTPETTELKIGGIKQTKSSEQAKLIPLGIITPNSQQLIEGGPRNRRRFLDWALFHVEHQYAYSMNQYMRVLLQRNKALKNSDSNIKIWDFQLAKLGEQITQKRKTFLSQFQDNLLQWIVHFKQFKDLHLQFKQGWNADIPLLEAISKKDNRFENYTCFGPHRADINFTINNCSIRDKLSRGELKIFTILLILSLLDFIKNNSLESPILLFDDFKSELDNHKSENILEMISDLGIQSFITMFDNLEDMKTVQESKVFHVEHGKVAVWG